MGHNPYFSTFYCSEKVYGVSEMKSYLSECSFEQLGNPICVLTTYNDTNEIQSFHNLRFDTTYFTSAESILETTSLNPILQSNCFVLIGNPQFPGPVVYSEKAKRCGFDTSLFDRLLQCPWINRTLLNIEKEITPFAFDFTNKIFYSSQVQVPPIHTNLDVTCVSRIFKNKKVPFMFIHCEGREIERNFETNFENAEEANIVKMLLSTLQNKNVPVSSIGVVSMFSAKDN
ncbi:hypothetical protein EIN_314850 [Entamoeba invadens IP1]|uniref:DNA2/NAM7 helicase-like C-terminal domain-containing protein n=1 Tax=Entamoeba invadens IP1 TaxID=370355 RepID=A0A0A1U585_ENTIV|nr:hypothetical protein EIN_314850 [Entamoeba invadens IP1]ELP86916.1 hypothetical protein EIN_314850 [Entamoeba invadens IP1]|eukprot:XP_004253687.1 hypothetical protein EIN_314850 [Entamoeba invadens IP1]